VSPPRPVPTDVGRPPYLALGGLPPAGDGRLVRTADEIERMRGASAAAARVLSRLAPEVCVGVTTDDLDAIAHDAYLAEGGYPSTLGYRGFPKSICTSVNEVVAHGIPDDRPLADGDIVNCDVTIYLDGVHGDCSATFLVGDVDAGTRHLVEVTRRCLDLGIATVHPGARVRDIGRAIQAEADEHGYGVVRELGGHDIGAAFHGPLFVPHFDDPRATLKLRPGMTFTIEPMLTLGDPDVAMWDDGWTIVTFDGQPSAQFEHTLLVTEDGAEILTVA
jgi:methionyl aminopeptidase